MFDEPALMYEVSEGVFITACQMPECYVHSDDQKGYLLALKDPQYKSAVLRDLHEIDRVRFKMQSTIFLFVSAHPDNERHLIGVRAIVGTHDIDGFLEDVEERNCQEFFLGTNRSAIVFRGVHGPKPQN